MRLWAAAGLPAREGMLFRQIVIDCSLRRDAMAAILLLHGQLYEKVYGRQIAARQGLTLDQAHFRGLLIQIGIMDFMQWKELGAQEFGKGNLETAQQHYQKCAFCCCLALTCHRPHFSEALICLGALKQLPRVCTGRWMSCKQATRCTRGSK